MIQEPKILKFNYENQARTREKLYSLLIQRFPDIDEAQKIAASIPYFILHVLVISPNM